MNIGLVSYRFINNDVSFNLKQIEKAMRAVSERCDLLCFGEAFLQGFDSLNWNYDMDKKVAVSQDSSIMDSLRALTGTYGVDLLTGYYENAEEKIYSSCVLIEDGQILHNYRRISKGWKESIADDHYREGDDTDEFMYKDHLFKIALCGDLWDHPERFKTDGTLLWPVYVNFDIEEWKNEEKEYAAQAAGVCSTALMVNPISDDPVCHGGAFVFTDGELFNDVIYDTENILIIGLESD